MPTKLYEKTKILDACFRVFADNGYTNTTTAMLADAAGISKALIFHYFKSKKHLYLSILRHCFKQMAEDPPTITISGYKDYFDARARSGFQKVDYLKKNPDIAKILYGAFYSTPHEIKSEIEQLRVTVEEQYGHISDSRESQMNQLFESIPLRDGVAREHALELINITMDYFNKRYLAELMDSDKLLDEENWQRFSRIKESFLDILKYGIQER